MLSTYRRVLSQPGALAFSATALVARFPIAMIGLGIVLLIEHETGSYGTAGAVSAVYVLAGALAAVVHGRLVDRFGQTRVLPVASTLNSASLALLMAAVGWGWPLWTAYAFAALTGLFMPQVGASVRTRWTHNVEGADALQTAFALESVLDEVAFIVGPVLVTFLATAWNPLGGLALAVATGLIGTWAYAAQRRTAPPYGRTSSRAERAPMPWAVLVPILVVCLSLGTLFGAAEVTTLAVADAHGHPERAGWLLATWSLGSLVAGLVSGAMAWRAPAPTRIRWGTAAMALTMLPLALIDSLAGLAVVLLLGGLAIAPTLIATISTVEQGVPRSRLTEGMALVNTGIVAGVAPGAALAGLVVDRFGPSAAYYVPLAAGLLGVAAAQLVRIHYPASHEH